MNIYILLFRLCCLKR